MKIQIEDRKKKVIVAAILMVACSVFTMFSIQYLLLEWELFMRTTDDILFLNVVCCLAFYLFVQLFTNNVAITCIISHVLLLLFGLVDFFVYEFRGNEFSFADISSAFTGLSVAGKYNFSINNRCIIVIIAAIAFIIIVSRFKICFEKKWMMRIVDVLLLIICCIIVVYNSMYTITETWEQKGTYRNGYILNFLLEIRDSFVSEPDGYSLDTVSELEDEYDGKDGSRSQSDVKNPTIIAIMSESYADMSVVGDFETNIPVTPFTDSLKENTLRGHALSSVYGAKTPNSEWEFLTGNSMAFLPDGSVVYQQYIDKEPSTLVTTLKDNDYTCVAMHPYYASGWNRSTIYPTMGFDETYFIDDFDQTNIIRDYIKDQELFDEKVIVDISRIGRY